MLGGGRKAPLVFGGCLTPRVRPQETDWGDSAVPCGDGALERVSESPPHGRRDWRAFSRSAQALGCQTGRLRSWEDRWAPGGTGRRTGAAMGAPLGHHP